jgi:hypothetical protein
MHRIFLRKNNLIVKGFNATVNVNESFEKEFKS